MFKPKVDIWAEVQKDMQQRDAMGKKKYGVDLVPFDGRDMLKEAYEEALDMVVYLRVVLYERDGK